MLVNPVQYTKRTVAPTTEPLTLTEAKAWLRIDVTDDDSLITNLITVVREACENYTNRSLITQTWTTYYDTWQRDPHIFISTGIRLRHGPVQSITSLTIFGNDDSSNVWPNTNYFLDPNGERLVFRLNITYPFFTRPGNGIQIIYVTGYSDTETSIPASLKQGMLHLLSHLYEHRETTDALPPAVQTLWFPYRINTL